MTNNDGSVIEVKGGGTLTLMTHDKKTPGGAVTGAGTIVELQGGTLVMQGGTISGGTSFDKFTESFKCHRFS